MNDELKKNGRMETWLAGGLIIVVAALTYGILIPQLGFYRDDWYMLWAGQSPGGLTAITRLFLTDRPLIGWVYALIFKFIGTNVLWWQLFGLVLKILTGLSALWLLRLIWPGKRLETLSAALLFVLYPGFYQQPVAATFCIDLLGLNAIICSMALTVLAVKTTNRVLKVLYILAAMLLGLVNLGLYEATIGLEVVRWALVWWMTHEGGQNQPQPVNPESPTKKTTITARAASAGIGGSSSSIRPIAASISNSNSTGRPRIARCGSTARSCIATGAATRRSTLTSRRSHSSATKPTRSPCVWTPSRWKAGGMKAPASTGTPGS